MITMQKEIWKPVRGFEEWAEVSNFGQIHYFARKSRRFTDEHWTYGSENDKGYLRATIGGVNKGVHQWVYLTFVGDIPEGLEVNHIDEDKYNNRLDNLNLMTRKENNNWGTRNRRAAASRSKAVQALDKNGNVVMGFPSTAEAQRQGFSSGNISNCCRGKHKSYKGYIWRYVDI